MSASLDVGDLQDARNWSGRYQEALDGEQVADIEVERMEHDSWRMENLTGTYAVKHEGVIYFSADAGSVRLSTTDSRLLLPGLLAQLSSPSLSYIERSLAAAEAIRFEMRGARNVWVIVGPQGDYITVDERYRLLHEMSYGGRVARLLDVNDRRPSLARFRTDGTLRPARMGLCQIGVSAEPGSGVAVTSDPTWDVVVDRDGWVSQIGPHEMTLRAALTWCEQRAAATQVGVDRFNQRTYFGTGSWKGRAFQPVPDWLLSDT